MLPNGTFDWYQSFITHYTLETWMKGEVTRRPNTPLTLLKRLEDIRVILNQQQWNEKANEAYLRLFDVNIAQSTGFVDSTLL